MNLDGSFADAMQLIAERLVFRKTASPADTAQDARAQLGILGANPGKIDAAVSGLNSGKLSPGAARSQIRGSVPGTLSQIRHLPGSIGVAAKQGRPGDALAAADVVGLKNINPFGEEFSPTATMLAAGAGGSTAAAQALSAKNRQMYDILHGVGDAVGEKGKGGVGIEGADATKLKAWRTANIPKEFPILDPIRQAKGLKGKATAGLKAVGSKLRSSLIGPTEASLAGSSVTRDALNHARRNLKTTPSRGSKMLPFAVASIPLLLKEWVGGGYRSGKKPAEQLVSANQEMHPPGKGGLLDRFKNMTGGK